METNIFEKQTKYFHMRDDKNRPVVTVCRIEQERNHFYHNRAFYYGWAICSALDNPNRSVGRNIARARALHAFSLKGKRIPYFETELKELKDFDCFVYERPIYRLDMFKAVLEPCWLKDERFEWSFVLNSPLI